MGNGAAHGGRQRWGALTVSLAIHGGAFVAFTNAPAIQLPHATESEYRQAIAGKEEKLVWYKFRELPRVTPPRAPLDPRPLRAAQQAKQSIVSSAENAPRLNRMVWTPAPDSAAAPPLDSPDLLAIKLPDPPVRPFVTPPDLPRREAAKIDVPDAPELSAQPLNKAEVRTVPLPPKPFVPPPAAPKAAMAQPQLAAEAPPLAAQPARAIELKAARLPPKPYVAPPPAARPNIAPVRSMDEAPTLAATVNPASSGVLGAALKLPPRPFTAPAPSPRGTASVRATTDTAPVPDLPGDAASLNVAIVGLNPLDKPAPLPAAPSPAAFSAGPKPRPDGAASEGAANGLSVPNLFVRGPRDAKPDPIGQSLVAQAYAAPTSKETLRAVMRRGEPVTIAASVPESQTGAARVSSAPDARFTGREVYMMAIQMPNLTSYSGSWLMWYAARTEREAGLAPIAPPVVHRKVDPKYLPAAVAERVEGRVRLACVIDLDGKVSNVELVRGADARLNEAAQEALAKWEFYPATRHGAPVEVDVLVEIPFVLAPLIPYRR